MTLRNAFDGVSTDGMLRRLVNNLNFARDSWDRLRVVIDGGTVTMAATTGNVGRTTTNWGAEGAYTAWYGVGAPASMDDREKNRLQARSNWQNIRNTRWTF